MAPSENLYSNACMKKGCVTGTAIVTNASRLIGKMGTERRGDIQKLVMIRNKNGIFFWGLV